MNIDINGISITLTQDQLDQVAKHLAKSAYPPNGTICRVWDTRPYPKYLRIATGNGTFYDGDSYEAGQWRNYEVVPMGISFSDTPITSSQITPDMHKQLALCWDITWTATNHIKVIDAHCNGVFSISGNGSISYDRYAICTTPIGNLPKMYQDMIDACKD